MNSMKPPCEIVVKKIIPAVRSILAMELSEKYGMSQAEIAENLSITQPAVSQYLNSGEKVRKVKESLQENEVYSSLEDLSKDMANGDKDSIELTRKYCDICKSMDLEEILSIVNPEGNTNLTKKDCQPCIEVRKND